MSDRQANQTLDGQCVAIVFRAMDFKNWHSGDAALYRRATLSVGLTRTGATTAPNHCIVLDIGASRLPNACQCP